MLEPGPHEAANLRILDPHVRGLQHHHPEPVHGVTGLEPATPKRSQSCCFLTRELKFELKTFQTSFSVTKKVLMKSNFYRE